MRYWYRVIARNSAGASEHSNVIGPVAATCRTLVDECRDVSLAMKTEGKVSPTGENARTVQEDCHRLALQPGAAIVYRVPGPISAWRLYSFASNKTPVVVAISQDGTSYQPTQTDTHAFPSAQTVYGYATPTLLSGAVDDRGWTYLRIAVPDEPKEERKSDPPPEKTGQQPLFEISRVEIEYDQAKSEAAAPPRKAQPAQLNSSIFIDSNRSLDVALNSIDQAARRGERQLNVVVTILVDLTAELRIKSFGGASSPDFKFRPCNDAMRAALKEKLHQVFARMAQHNMGIFLLPHIDAGGKVRQWRNWVDFDPLVSYNGYSYTELMLGTIADALEESVTPSTRIELALSGEMGTSLFRYPESYRTIVRQLRDRSKLKQLKVGISLNHGGIAGSNNPTGVPDIQLSDDERRQLQSLIDECDFVGMSFYAPVSISPTSDDFVVGIDRFMNEFKEYGLAVPTTTPMHFSEVGIGGRSARSATLDPAQAVQAPWEGTANPRENPWSQEPMRKLRRQYHQALLEFLADQPAKWRVSGAFFWSMGSWDPLGHGQPQFADSGIVAAIEEHNRRVP
jgi:hypothetical protein